MKETISLIVHKVDDTHYACVELPGQSRQETNEVFRIRRSVPADHTGRKTVNIIRVLGRRARKKAADLGITTVVNLDEFIKAGAKR